MSALPIRRRNRRFPTIFRPRVSDDLAAAQEEYGSTVSPFADLSQFLNRPVFDRGTLPEAEDLTVSAIGTDRAGGRFGAPRLPFPGFTGGLRQTDEISNLRDMLRQPLSSAGDAPAAERSAITKALEGRIEDLQRGIDAETLDLRTSGLSEREALARQIEEGDRLVREAQEASAGSLQESLGSLSGDLSDINEAIDASRAQFDQPQQAAADATQAELSSLNQQLESLYTDVESGNAAQSEDIRNETASLIAGLEQQIGGLAEKLGALPIETIQSQLASVNDQTAQFQQAVNTATGERAALASRIDALQAAGLTQDDLAAAINPIAQQRQEAISAAVNPIQEQIAALRQEIPQQVDTEALRQQIKDEIMASLPQQQTAPVETVTQPIAEPVADAPVDVGPSASEAAGFNPAVSVNVSDGQADAMGLFDDPRPMQQFNRTPGVRDTVAVPVMRGNQMTGRTGPFIPDMRDIMQGVNVRGAGL